MVDRVRNSPPGSVRSAQDNPDDIPLEAMPAPGLPGLPPPAGDVVIPSGDKHPITIAYNAVVNDPLKAVVALGRTVVRGPLPSIAPLLATDIGSDPSLTSGKHRAAIALGAFSVAESVLTGDHKFQWHPALVGNRLTVGREARMRQRAERSAGEVSANLRRIDLDAPETQVAMLAFGMSEKHASDAINGFFDAMEQLGSLSMSALSYWHVVAGNGPTPVGSLACPCCEARKI